jgi:hypothetical protein
MSAAPIFSRFVRRDGTGSSRSIARSRTGASCQWG